MQAEEWKDLTIEEVTKVIKYPQLEIIWTKDVTKCLGETADCSS